MQKPSIVAGLALACLAVPGQGWAHDHTAQRGRLVFADYEKPVLRVLDLDTGEVTHSFPVPKPNPGFAGVAGGRHVVVKTGDDAGTIRILDTGLTIESHGDHVDIEKGEVKLLDLAVIGDKPAHVVSGKGRVALFYDGHRPWERKSQARAVLLEIDKLAVASATPLVWNSPAPQHGIAVPLGGRQWLMSMPNPTYARGEDRSASSRPDGFEVLEQPRKADGTWKRIADFNVSGRPDASCSLFHGYAASENRHVFGCAEGQDGGVLVISREGKGQWRGRRLIYPDNRRVSSIKARDGARFMVANYGAKAPYDALLRIDPKATAMSAADIHPVPGGQAACQFELDGKRDRLANLTADGKLRIYEIASWRELASFDAVAGFDCQFGAKTPTPNLAVIGASAFVSDPGNGRIREYRLDTLKQGLDMPVGGMPANLAGSDAG